MLRTQHHIQWVLWGSLLGIKQPQRELDHSSINKVREWTGAVTLEILAVLLDSLYWWRSEFGLVLRPCITTVFVLTHQCTGDFGIKIVQLLTLQNWRMLWKATDIIINIQGHDERYWRGATLKVTGMIGVRLISSAFTGTFQELNWHTYWIT